MMAKEESQQDGSRPGERLRRGTGASCVAEEGEPGVDRPFQPSEGPLGRPVRTGDNLSPSSRWPLAAQLQYLLGRGRSWLLPTH